MLFNLKKMKRAYTNASSHMWVYIGKTAFGIYWSFYKMLWFFQASELMVRGRSPCSAREHIRSVFRTCPVTIVADAFSFMLGRKSS